MLGLIVPVPDLERLGDRPVAGAVLTRRRLEGVGRIILDQDGHAVNRAIRQTDSGEVTRRQGRMTGRPTFVRPWFSEANH